MVKRTVFFIACILFVIIAIIPTYTMAEFYVIAVNNSPLTGAQKSICDYPYWQTTLLGAPLRSDMTRDPTIRTTIHQLRDHLAASDLSFGWEHLQALQRVMRLWTRFQSWFYLTMTPGIITK